MKLAPHLGRGVIPAESLAFDIDGVIADTMELFVQIARKHYGITSIAKDDIKVYQLDLCLDIEPEIITAVIERILNGDYHIEFEPIVGARRVLRRLCRLRPLLMVTARPHPGPVQGLLEDMLKGCDHGFDVVAVGSHKAKAKVLKQAGITHFVEDRLDTCFILDQEGITPILFRQPWNRQNHPFLEVAGWDQLEALLSWK